MIESELIDERTAAAKQVASLEGEYSDDVDEHEDNKLAAIGVGLAAGVLAFVAFFWAGFRTSPPARWLAEQSLGKTLAACGGGVFAALVVGAILGSLGGFARVIGVAIVNIAVGLLVALLAARHSLRVETGAKKPASGRKRMPRWVLLDAAIAERTINE